MKTNKLKLNVFLVSIAVLIGLLHSCYEDETSNESNQPITTSYNATILSYLASLKSEASKENGAKIEALKEAINLNTIHIYNLKSTEKLLIADISTLKGFESYNATKVIFFILNNSIIRSNIVTIKNKVPFDNVNQVLISIFDRKENKDNYSGKIEFYNLFKNILLSDEFENGKLTVNGVKHRSPNSSLTTKSNGCVAWYWVTTYFDGTQTKEYMYTTCDCEEQTYKGDCGGGASSGGGSSSTNNNSAGPNYPDNPNDKDLYTYIDYDGEIVTRQYDMKSKSWIIVSIKLPDVVVNNNPEKYSFLIFAWPSDGQKILNNLILYTYDAASGNWNGEPETPEKIAEAIEEQINDSQLDPCTKAIMEKLKNATQSDIAKMLSRFAPAGSIFNINMSIGQVTTPNDLAQTTKVKGSSTDINMVFSENYINGVGNPNRPTDLSIATTMAHEIIHAYLISLLEENKTCGASGICDFPTIYDAYVQKQIDKGSNILADAHHELIAKQYVFAIATTIQEFHTGQYTDYPYQNYLDMAWGGLQGTYIFNKNYPDDPTHKNYKDRLRIMAKINTEKLGTQYGIYYPLGTPCKK